MFTPAIVYVTKRCRLEPHRNIVLKKDFLMERDGYLIIFLACNKICFGTF